MSKDSQRANTAPPRRTGVGVMIMISAYIALLHTTYVTFVTPTFAYLGMGYREPNWGVYATMIGGLVVLGLLMPPRVEAPSAWVCWLLYLLAVVPTVVLAQVTPILGPTVGLEFGLAVLVCWLCVLVLLKFASSAAMLQAHRARSLRPEGWLAVLVLLSLLATCATLLLPNVSFEFASLSEVTDVRLRYRDMIAQAPVLVPYLLLAAVNVANPALIAWGLMQRRRSYIFAAIGFGGQLLNYSVTGYKSVLLSVFAIPAISWWVYRRSPGASRFTGIMVFGMAISLAAYVWAGSTSLITFFTTRMIIVPGNVAAGHVAVFNDLPMLNWGYSVLSGLVDYPYSKSPSFIVGTALSGNQDTQANVNLFGRWRPDAHRR